MDNEIRTLKIGETQIDESELETLFATATPKQFAKEFDELIIRFIELASHVGCINESLTLDVNDGRAIWMLHFMKNQLVKMQIDNV